MPMNTRASTPSTSSASSTDPVNECTTPPTRMPLMHAGTPGTRSVPEHRRRRRTAEDGEVLCEDVHKVGARRTHVQKHRQPKLPHEIELRCKPPPLRGRVAELQPVIVEAALPDSDRLALRDALPDDLHVQRRCTRGIPACKRRTPLTTARTADVTPGRARLAGGGGG